MAYQKAKPEAHQTKKEPGWHRVKAAKKARRQVDITSVNTTPKPLYGVWLTYQGWTHGGFGGGGGIGGYSDLTGTRAEMEARIRTWIQDQPKNEGVQFEARPYVKNAPPIDARALIVEAIRNLSPYDYGDSWTTVLSLADMIEGGLGKP